MASSQPEAKGGCGRTGAGGGEQMAHPSLIKGCCRGPINPEASHWARCVREMGVLFPFAEHLPSPSRRDLELRRGSESNGEAETWSLEDWKLCARKMGEGKSQTGLVVARGPTALSKETASCPQFLPCRPHCPALPQPSLAGQRLGSWPNSSQPYGLDGDL